MLTQLHELISVSDLHLGGEPGRQIFAGTERLTALIRDLAQRPLPREVAFVVNGDAFDFLAEEGAKAFDPYVGAKLERILRDPSFEPIMQAWRELVSRPHSRLVFVLGNHDLELGLHDVRQRIVAELSGGSEAAAGRVVFATDGAGYSARVGTSPVLCIHGNDTDDWNLTDYEKLRRIVRDRHFGLPVMPWTPNAGSKMVVEVMNGIKRHLPFVDLLKPETDAVVPLLLAFDQANIDRLRGAAAVATRLTWDVGRSRFGFLGEDGEDGDEQGRAIDPLESILADALTPVRDVDDDRLPTNVLLAKAEEWMIEGRDPLDLIESRGTLGVTDWVAAVWRRLFGANQKEALRTGLSSLAKDRSFERTEPDKTFRRLDQQISNTFRFLIAGHTHLERSLPRQRGGHYFNTGTWARLIRLRPEVLNDQALFDTFVQQIQLPTIADLDAVPGLVEQRSCYAHVFEDGGQTIGALRRVTGSSPFTYEDLEVIR